jgi:hypothetical protein
VNPQVPYAQPGYGQPPPPYPGTTPNPVPQVIGLTTHCIPLSQKCTCSPSLR